MKSSTSIAGELFKEKIDQLDQTIRFCNFKISKGKDMSIAEIIEMKKINDPNLAALIEVQLSLCRISHNSVSTKSLSKKIKTSTKSSSATRNFQSRNSQSECKNQK